MNFSEDGNRTRRQFLKAAAVAGAVGTAGCLGTANGDTYVDPEYAMDIPERWVQIDTIKRENSFTGLSAYTKGTVYTDSIVKQEVNSKTLGKVNANLVVFTGAQINLEGVGAGVVSPKDVLNNAESELLSRVRETGVTDIKETSEAVMRSDRASAHKEYLGVYPVPEQSFKIPVPNRNTPRTVTFPEEQLEVRVFISVIDPDQREDMLLVAGAYPTESYSAEKSVSLSGSETDGINVTIDIDLDLKPMTYQERLKNLVAAIRLR